MQFTLLAALIAGGAAVPRAGVAQAPAQAPPPPTEEIRVTASRRETRLHEVPFTISASGHERLAHQRIDDLAELSRWVPGFTVVDQGARGGNPMIVRGLNVNSLNASEFLGNSGGGTVATYVGEIPLYLDLRNHDLNRIEVLLGPQGTLYGAGTLGGAVRYIPNAPSIERMEFDVFSDIFSLEDSGRAGVEAGAVLNAPLVEDRLAFRASVSYLDDPGFIDYDHLVREPGVSDPEPDAATASANLYSVKDANTERTLSGRLALLFRTRGSTEATFNYYRQQRNVGARTMNHRESFGTGRFVSAHRVLEPNDRRSELVSVEIESDLGFAALSSATGISSYHEIGQRDQTDLLLDFQVGFEQFPSFVAFTHEDAEEDTLTQEIRLVSHPGERRQWIGGMFFSKYDVDATSREFTPGTAEFFGIDRPDDLEYIQVTAEELTERALFGEVGFELTEKLRLAFGGRWFGYVDHQNIGFDMPIMNGTPDQILLQTQENLIEDDGFIARINSSYEFDAGLMAYATLSEGYRIGGANSVPPCQLPLPPGQNVCALPDEILIEPDRTLNYEIGVRSAMSGGTRVDAALYYIDWSDIQTMSTTVNGAIPITVNGGRARSYGLEVSLTARLSDRWSLGTSYANNRAELASDAPGLVDGRQDAFAGDRLPGTPRHQGSFGVRYLRPLANGWQFGLDYGLSFTSDVVTKVGSRNNGETLGGYALHDASLRFLNGSWSVQVYVENLTDKYAETSVRQDRSFVRDVNGFALRRYYKNVLRPRTIGVEFRFGHRPGE